MSVKEFDDCTRDTFQSCIYQLNKPALLKNIDLGTAVSLWGSTDYLISRCRDKPVKVHVSPTARMDFIGKNFVYRTLPFDELVRRCSQREQKEYFISPDECYYLRAVGDNPRKDVANLCTDYPALAQDIILPSFFPPQKFFSSVLRIASPGMQLWTHYDVMDNFLIQVVGRKRVVLFPPSAIQDLYLVGDKSQVLDIDNPDIDAYPRFSQAQRLECVMHPGDVLFMPALWFHNVTSIDYGVAVNTFWRGLDERFYDTKDTYGNKDPPQVQRSLQILDRALGLLDDLPNTFREFYSRRIIARVEERLSKQHTTARVEERLSKQHTTARVEERLSKQHTTARVEERLSKQHTTACVEERLSKQQST